MRNIYITVRNSKSKKTGGLVSTGILEDYFKNNGFSIKIINLVSIKKFLILNLFKKRNRIEDVNLYLLSPNYTNNCKDKIKLLLNKIILSKSLREFQSKIIIDGLIPINFEKLKRDEFKKIFFYTTIRSSPSCFGYVNVDLRRKFFISQLDFCNNWICASKDISENWKSFCSNKNKRIINLPVPVKSLIEKRFINETQKSKIKHLLDQEKMNIILACGTIGPRKGTEQLIRQLKSQNMDDKIDTHIFGDFDENEMSNYSQLSDIKLHGFVQHDFAESIDQSTLIRCFPAYSECYSRVQVEGILSGDPCLFSAQSLDPDFLEFISKESVCFGIDQMVQKINLVVEEKLSLASLKPKSENFKNYIKEKLEKNFSLLIV